MAIPIEKKNKGDGVDIQLSIWPGSGEPILCVHGLTANGRCWETIAAGLEDHQLIAMDLRGRGLSDKPDTGYSVDQHSRDIESVLDQLQLDRVTIMGHSLGAFIATHFAANYSDRVSKVVLVDGGGQLSEEQMGRVVTGITPSLLRLGQVFPSFDDYRDLLLKAPFNNPWSDVLESYYRYEVESVEGGVSSRVQPTHIQEEMVNLGQFDVAQTYPDITCPVLILRATEGMLAKDDILLPEDVTLTLLSQLSDSRRVDVPGTNHYSIVFDSNSIRDDALKLFIES